MKKKRIPASEPVISSEILSKARKSLQPDRLPRSAQCVVCGAECAPSSSEHLCWVCRRLKISAHEGEQQLPAQE